MSAADPAPQQPEAGQPGQPQRQLPAHIQRSLEQQKNRIAGGRNLTDTAGQPWAGRDFEHSQPADPADDGTIDPALERLLNAWSRGEADEVDVVAGLPGVRLFVAARAQHADDPTDLPGAHTDHGHADEDHAAGDKAADMVLSSLTAPDGRKALPVFTSADKVVDWSTDARPIPFDARRLALSCVQDGASLMVLDPGAGVNFVVRRPAVWSLGKGESWVPSYRDAEVARALADLSDGIPQVARILPAQDPRSNARAASGPAAGQALRGGGLGPELECRVYLHSGLTRTELDGLMDRVAHHIGVHAVLADRADSLSLKVLDASQL